MSTRRTSDNNGNETIRSDSSNNSSRPKGVRPPSRTATGVSSKTAAVGGGSGAGAAPTRFSQATQVFSENDSSAKSGVAQKRRGKMTGCLLYTSPSPRD